MGATPCWSDWLLTEWGFPDDNVFSFGNGANNVVVGTNPPFTLQDFFALYPKFGGATVALAGAVTVQDSNSITVTSSSTLAIGNPVAVSGVPDGALIQSIPDATHIVLNVPATASGTSTLTAWNAPPMPFAIILAYLMLASASLVQARWCEMWPVAMGLYVSHFLTLYARSDGNPLSSVGQIAAQGIATGIQVAKSVGDVSVSYQPVTGLEDWGSWNRTEYGQQLATFAKIVGGGPMMLY